MMNIKRILHPTDFSEGALEAYEHAIHLARHCNSRLDVLHVVSTFGDQVIPETFQSSFGEKVWKER